MPRFTDLKYTIAMNIVRIREQSSITQLELGLGLGYKEENAQSRISQYEKGVRSPGKKTLEKIAKILRVSLEDLIREAGGEHRTETKNEPTDFASKRLLNIFKQLDSASKRSVLRYAEERKQLMRLKKRK